MRCGLAFLLVICLSALAHAQEWVGARPRVIPWTRSGVADRVRLGVRTEGLYAVTAAEVATATGLSTATVVNAFQSTNLTLSCQGFPVPCSVINEQLFFKGESAFLKRAPENVYWLQLNTGTPSLPWPPEPLPTNDWTMVTTSIQGTNEVSYCTVGTLTNLPSYLAFKSLTGGNSFSVTNIWGDGVTNMIAGEVSVTLLSSANGETFPHAHQARVSFNDHVLGTPEWENEAYRTFTFPVPGVLLTNGLAVIRVENLLPNNTNARFFWAKLSLTVAKRTDIERPLLRPSVRGVLDADGFAADDVADYVVLIPPEGWVLGFRETIEPLVLFRSQQGLRTAIMDVESLYNRFTHGLADPEAIRAFCRNADASESVKLNYLLLAGSGSFDFAHERIGVPDYNACLIPPLMAAQSFSTGEAMLVAVDQAFGDISGDAAPEISVGRYPTAWTQELAVAVAKALAYDESLPWKSQAGVAAGASFTQDMNVVKGKLQAAGKSVTNYYPAKLTTWSNSLKAALQSGLGTFWFIGHSHTTYFGEGVSESDKLMDIARLKATTWSKMPLAILMGCHLNRWQTLNISMPDASSFGPFSVFRSGSGFSAVFASTGYAWDGVVGPSGESQMLALYLAEASGSNGVYRLGDAIRCALQRLAVYDPPINPLLPYYDPPPITAERLQSYSLVGDPAMMWRHDYSSAGTPVSWLLSHGLTAWDGDVSDQDGDGWRAWQEFQVGTRPETNQLRVAVQSLQTGSGWLGLTFETQAHKRYRILWKYSLEGIEPWAPISWAWGETGEPNPSSELIIPYSPMSSITVPLRPGDAQGFFRIQQAE